MASNQIIRLNSSGSIDAGFNVGSGFDGSVLTIAATTNGSGDVYVGGLFNNYNGVASNHIIRLNPAGLPN